MKLSELTAISPIDGRYRKNVAYLAEFFSEYAFMRYRIRVEVEYTLALVGLLKIRKVSKRDEEKWRAIYREFVVDEAEKIATVDSTWNGAKDRVTRHDFKAVEYFIRDRLKQMGYVDCESFVHFGLTTYDIEIPAYGLALKEANEKVILPTVVDLINVLQVLVKQNSNLVMLGRTHGQTAVPTTLGKELKNFLVRIEKIKKELDSYKFEAKLDGAVGNFNALMAAYPEVDWQKFSDEFIRNFGLLPNHFTTQILPYDNWLLFFFKIKLLNNVLIGFCQDMWRYISDDYFIQVVNREEVGSSTMPQKVNPISFENAEGNLGIANSIINFFENKLPISRLQRDLSDKTVKRNFGVAIGHSLFAYQNIVSGLGKVVPNEQKMKEELEDHWEVIIEGVQVILRAEGVSDAYEKLKDLTRGKKLTKKDWSKLISNMPFSKKVKKRLTNLSPSNYTGLAEKLASL